MKKASEIYEKAECGFSILDREKAKDPKYCEYTPMLHEFGEILLRKDEDGYKGNTFVLYRYRENGKIGYLVFEWGSCPCCDAYQACETIEHLQKLMDDLQEKIHWLGRPSEALAWFEKQDWDGRHFGCCCWEFKEFLIDAKKRLKRMLGGNK